MSIKYQNENLSTNSVNKILIPLFTMATALVGQPSLQETSNLYHPASYFENSVVTYKFESTHSVENTQDEWLKYYKLSVFAKSFLEEQIEVPSEFNNYFRENFWDLLA